MSAGFPGYLVVHILVQMQAGALLALVALSRSCGHPGLQEDISVTLYFPREHFTLAGTSSQFPCSNTNRSISKYRQDLAFKGGSALVAVKSNVLTMLLWCIVHVRDDKVPLSSVSTPESHIITLA